MGIGKALSKGMGLLPAIASGAMGEKNKGFALGIIPGMLYKQNAKEDEKSQSTVKNAYLSFQVGYQKYNRVTEDDTHKDKYFRYGYVGQFNNFRFNNPTLSDTIKAVDYDYNGDGIVDTTSTRLLPGKLYSSCASLNGTLNVTVPTLEPLLLTPYTSRVCILGCVGLNPVIPGAP